MVQIKLIKVRLTDEDAGVVVFTTGDDGTHDMLCLLDNGWILADSGDVTFFFPPHRILNAEGVI
ncbi:MAG: hypothetical protein KAS32_14775 [Candidatus Peribacteraceae bacterium]|nr:hypothetical protein [Candidatus Peribacteraceae bacterium]